MLLAQLANEHEVFLGNVKIVKECEILKFLLFAFLVDEKNKFKKE